MRITISFLIKAIYFLNGNNYSAYQTYHNLPFPRAISFKSHQFIPQQMQLQSPRSCPYSSPELTTCPQVFIGRNPCSNVHPHLGWVARPNIKHWSHHKVLKILHLGITCLIRNANLFEARSVLKTLCITFYFQYIIKIQGPFL